MKTMLLAAVLAAALMLAGCGGGSKGGSMAGMPSGGEPSTPTPTPEPTRTYGPGLVPLPTGHTLETGTLPAGGSRTVGEADGETITIECTPGEDEERCSFTVAPDGTVRLITGSVRVFEDPFEDPAEETEDPTPPTTPATHSITGKIGAHLLRPWRYADGFDTFDFEFGREDSTYLLDFDPGWRAWNINSEVFRGPDGARAIDDVYFRGRANGRTRHGSELVGSVVLTYSMLDSNLDFEYDSRNQYYSFHADNVPVQDNGRFSHSETNSIHPRIGSSGWYYTLDGGFIQHESQGTPGVAVGVGTIGRGRSGRIEGMIAFEAGDFELGATVQIEPPGPINPPGPIFPPGFTPDVPPPGFPIP